LAVCPCDGFAPGGEGIANRALFRQTLLGGLGEIAAASVAAHAAANVEERFDHQTCQYPTGKPDVPGTPVQQRERHPDQASHQAAHDVTVTREQRAASRREGNSSRPTERLRQPRQHREVGVQRDALKATNAERCESVVVLEPPKLPFDGGPATVKRLPLLRVARDVWEQPPAERQRQDGHHAWMPWARSSQPKFLPRGAL
jgi:hypothetical protein